MPRRYAVVPPSCKACRPPGTASRLVAAALGCRPLTERPIPRFAGSAGGGARAMALVLAAAALPAAHGEETQGPRPSINALAIDAPIVVDGVLDEAIWERAELGGDFTAREPIDRLPASEATEFSVLYTASTIYFGIRAYDSNPGAIVAKEMERDSPMGQNDDSI